jgi:hypothetical protein
MKTIRGLKIAAMIPLGFMVLILLLLGIGEMLSGDWSGSQHFIPVLFVGLVVWLCWKRPLWGGLLLLSGAAISVLIFWRFFTSTDPTDMLGPLTIMILPLAFSGLLLLTSEWLTRIQHAPE